MDATAVDHRYEIEVNTTQFVEHHAQRSGLEIKQDAIAAATPIKLTYVLEEEREHGNVRIGDNEVVRMRNGLRFLAHPGGSDS